MHSVRILFAVIAFLGAVPAAGQRLEGATGTLAERLLAAHNRERAAVGAPALAGIRSLPPTRRPTGPCSQAFASWFTRRVKPVPASARTSPWLSTARSAPNSWSISGAAKSSFLTPGLFPNVSRTGKWEDIAHYTQMVWPTTTRVGCAIFAADWDYLICRYSPPGNKDGKPVFLADSSVPASIVSHGGN